MVARAFSYLWTKCEILIVIENNFFEAVHQTSVGAQRRYVHPLNAQRFK